MSLRLHPTTKSDIITSGLTSSTRVWAHPRFWGGRVVEYLGFLGSRSLFFCHKGLIFLSFLSFYFILLLFSILMHIYFIQRQIFQISELMQWWTVDRRWGMIIIRQKKDLQWLLLWLWLICITINVDIITEDPVDVRNAWTECELK